MDQKTDWVYALSVRTVALDWNSAGLLVIVEAEMTGPVQSAEWRADRWVPCPVPAETPHVQTLLTLSHQDGVWHITQFGDLCGDGIDDVAPRQAFVQALGGGLTDDPVWWLRLERLGELQDDMANYGAQGAAAIWDGASFWAHSAGSWNKPLQVTPSLQSGDMLRRRARLCHGLADLWDARS